jgi:microcin C transport system permease protein
MVDCLPMMQILKNPVTRKRMARFRAMKRAYGSLWILGILYGLSLVAELLCGNAPLYVRFDGVSYFPVVKYYAETEFTRSGRLTRPDYRKLNRSPVFSENPDNFMIFPLIPFSPLESIDPKTIAVADRVKLRLTPIPRIGTIDIARDGSIARAVMMDAFFDGPDTPPMAKQMAGTRLDAWFALPQAFDRAIDPRFANQSAPRVSFDVAFSENYSDQGAGNNPLTATLATFRPRSVPPDTIRVTIADRIAETGRYVFLVFDRSLSLISDPEGMWPRISGSGRHILEELIARRFDRYVEAYSLPVDGRQYKAMFLKEDVRFPYPPVKGHLLGIDSAGRDVLARIIYGLRISLTFGLLLVGCSMLLGVMAGAVQGYYAGKLDITAQRLIEIWSALPFLYVMILMGAVYGRSFMLLLVCYGLFNWVGISYYIRAEFLSLRKRPFVAAAKCMGVSSAAIIVRHILPNALVPVITFFPFYLVGAIGSLAALDYLGFGLPPPTPSWGELLFQAQQYRWAWWLILYPALALFIVMLLGVFVGEGVRNAYDPKQYSRLR